MLNLEKRYRLIYKPLVFIASLLPLAWMVCGAFGWLGQSLGPDPVKRLEHFCGQTALNFLMITLVVSPLRELAKWPNVLRLRRMLGLFAFFYVLLHFTIYVVLDQELAFRSVLADVAKRPYITIGFAALLMLIPLAITSTNRMMRRLGRRWQKLHRLIYVIAVLGVWHYYWQVKRDVREPLLYAAILAVLLGYRYVRRRRQLARSRGARANAQAQLTSRSAPATAQERN
ncbi:MAG TPA: protein-methionine-sulfoxide reductase heme-binding subunit MsrQ [Steroidobacteraceae bacterium]|nr:protein-methionine-sulfoxide reductase heme-binding subunit MsrQ [Steroidobacteraceae bacterium]